MSDCVIFQGLIDKNDGYGRVSQGFRKSKKLAHRVAYEQAGKKIPEGHVLHHTCGVRACVNPDHLVPMTIGDHLRMHNTNPICGTCGEPRTGKGGRHCLPCRRRQYRERKAAHVQS